MKKTLKKVFLIIIGIYVLITLINQQKTLNQYSKNEQELAEQIQQQEDIKQELAEKKDDVNSLDFIEQTAREKLDMYYPNERVYIDQGM